MRNALEPIRFWRQVNKTETCWLWTGVISRTGYARMKIKRNGQWRTGYAHVVSYEMANGPVPQGLELDHLCRVRHCVNPAHLEAVTPRENWLRGKSPGAIAVTTNLCKRGHELSGSNVVRYNGQRYCRTCRLTKSKEWKRAWRRNARLSR